MPPRNTTGSYPIACNASARLFRWATHCESTREWRPGKGGRRGAPTLKAAAEKVVAAFDEWHARTKPQALVDAMDELRDALR
jgi:hypothetical protein